MKRHLASVGLLTAIAVPALGWPPAWGDPVPSLSISLDDGTRETAPGAESTYTLRISNQGTTRLRRILLVQSLPPSMTLVKADAGGHVEQGKVAWTVNVLPRKDTVVHLSARVGAVAGAQVRDLATTACARRSAAGPVLVCATDVNTVALPETTDWVLPISLASAAAAGLATTAFLLHRRRRRAQPA
ncbi:hypothetical protein OG884_15990 [Streptosporangium sp. NBC_01755]|uniref:hypothetical protein n=1 Tax=unclassified Streptosporangium TaxID=2632669 RepID=UPI002DD80D1A|nr:MULTISPECIES: hypothetical protein [unclassified Streptosporangium]WSA25351.1 hypothetical protein OIE13_31245 [Streptosporangium sp. NBC_01810]WSD03333.1 hypothetical protein OG884_15990 [Streptosporangium sp. NBC_01755]